MYIGGKLLVVVPYKLWKVNNNILGTMNLQKYHVSDKMRHPGIHAEAMSNFVSTLDCNIVLQSDTCVCIIFYTLYKI